MSALPVTNTGGSGTQCILLISFFYWGISSVGRASALHAEGQRFETVILHQVRPPLLNPAAKALEKVIALAVATVKTIWED